MIRSNVKLSKLLWESRFWKEKKHTLTL